MQIIFLQSFKLLWILLSGIFHVADERNFKTAYSYFYEAFEGYGSIDFPKAVTGLEYVLLSKIGAKHVSENTTFVSSRTLQILLNFNRQTMYKIS